MRKIAYWYFGFAVFLLVCGLIGYLSNPERAQTALKSGVGFGGLFATWGWFFLKGHRWPRIAGLVTCAILLIAFGWRGIISWQIVFSGGGYKVMAATLITVMFAGSLITTWKTWKLRLA